MPQSKIAVGKPVYKRYGRNLPYFVFVLSISILINGVFIRFKIPIIRLRYARCVGLMPNAEPISRQFADSAT